MTLTGWSDLSAADWLAAGDRPWEQLVSLGPPGFPAYARLRFLPDPDYEGQRENDAHLDAAGLSETAQLRIVLAVLSGHTRTPDDCYFCLWDGWGTHERNGVRVVAPRAGAVEAEPGLDPSFSPPGSREPMVVVPNRAYFLFHGTVTDLGDAGPGPVWPGQLGEGRADPAFIWPADRTWCIANDVDPHWAGIGADDSAVDELVADPRLDVVRADPRAPQPRYR